ncbi:hypothetical protein [Leptospira levettii]|uniref:SH3 domain-containing protein n=1 Tax=Leptospira levettii TaxID=2023178 RepID=A0AAW5V6D6_9LEPT|nr:hypothetical protein [Leptospira levettii]MCW7513424.1 hypothetical protein [Leptospira levettii]MCW7517190.1 hypothetical protein [Leptospira levettii]
MRLIYFLSITTFLNCNNLKFLKSDNPNNNSEVSIQLSITKEYLTKQNFTTLVKFTIEKMKISMSGYGGCTCSEANYKIENNNIYFTSTNSCYIKREICDNWISKFDYCFLETNNTNLEYKENLVCKENSILRKFDNFSKPENEDVPKLLNNMTIMTVLKTAVVTKKTFCFEEPKNSSKKAIINKDLLIYENDESKIEDPLLPNETIKLIASLPDTDWYLISADHESFHERCWIKRQTFKLKE